IYARGERVDDERFIGARKLHDAEQGIVGGLAQELCVDGNDRMLGEPLASSGEFRSGRNQIHVNRSLAESAFMSRVLRRIQALHFEEVRVASRCDKATSVLIS